MLGLAAAASPAHAETPNEMAMSGRKAVVEAAASRHETVKPSGHVEMDADNGTTAMIEGLHGDFVDMTPTLASIDTLGQREGLHGARWQANLGFEGNQYHTQLTLYGKSAAGKERVAFYEGFALNSPSRALQEADHLFSLDSRPDVPIQFAGDIAEPSVALTELTRDMAIKNGITDPHVSIKKREPGLIDQHVKGKKPQKGTRIPGVDLVISGKAGQDFRAFIANSSYMDTNEQIDHAVVDSLARVHELDVPFTGIIKDPSPKLKKVAHALAQRHHIINAAVSVEAARLQGSDGFNVRLTGSRGETKTFFVFGSPKETINTSALDMELTRELAKL